MPLPMLLLGLMVVLSVGFGVGTVFQFDQDWRSGSPMAIEAVSGEIGLDLDRTVTDLLAGTATPVKWVDCASPTPAARDALAGGAGTTGAASGAGLVNPTIQVCRALGAQGPLTIVTQSSGDQVDLTVFAAR